MYCLLFSFYLYSFADAQSTFEKIIDTLGCTSANCVQETFDGGYILCGQGNLNAKDASIIKLDSAGTIEWVKIYPGPGIEVAVYIEQTPDSGYIVDGLYNDDFNWLLRLDANGDTLWTKIFSAGAGSTKAHQLVVGENYNYGLTGYLRNPPQQGEAYLIITDSSGLMHANKVYPTTYGSVGYAIAQANQSNYIISGSKKTSTGLTSDIYLLRTDSVGDTLWTKTYDNSQSDASWAVEQTTDSGFITAGVTFNNATFKDNVYLIKTNTTGDSIWKKQYGGATDCFANSVQQTTDGGYIIAGSAADPANISYNVYLIKTDQNGDTLWTRQFGGNYPDLGYFVRQTHEGGYIISGKGSNGIVGGIYLIKTDSMGNVSTITGTTEVNNPFSFGIYPNPSNGIFTLQLRGNKNKNSRIEIYNLFNQVVYSSPVNGINSSKEIDLTGIANGMYLVVLQTGDQLFSRKIIVQK